MNAVLRLCRFFSTLLAYLLFGVVGCSLALILPVLLRFCPPGLPGQLRARRMVARVWSGYLVWMRLTGIFRVQWHGRERLGRPGQLILVNHPSLMDVLFMISAVPEGNCVVKASLLKNPSMRPAIRACGFIPNDESLELIEKTDAVLIEGQTLIIFPEGTRNLGDELLPFKSGIYHLAREWPQVEFVPVWLENLHRVMPKGHVIPLPLLCTVNFGAPVLLQTDDAMDSKTLYLQRCRDALQALKPVRD